MNRQLIIVLTLFLVLTQWGSLEHAYHDHSAGEACDYCSTSKSLDHIVLASSESVVHTVGFQWHDELISQDFYKAHVNYFTARAPPHTI